MAKYAKYNENNEITGFYSKDVHGNNIPENTISITDSTWQEMLSNGSSNYRVDLSSNSIIPFIKPIQERIDNIKNNKINSIKNNCKLKIESIYPQWKQNNLQADSDYARYAIQQLEEMNTDNGGILLSSDEIVNNATSKVGMVDTISELNQIDVDSLDLTDLSNINIQDVKDVILSYYKDIIKSIIAHRIIRIYRNHSNQLEIDINNIYNNSDLTDEEKLNQLENFEVSYDNI